jgi:hypothetical protein
MCVVFAPASDAFSRAGRTSYKPLLFSITQTLRVFNQLVRLIR